MEHNETTPYNFGGMYIPGRMMGGLQRWIEHGITPGDFLYAVICNDLRKACDRADDENLRNIPAFVAYFYNRAPSECWGSAEKAKAWSLKKRAEINDIARELTTK